MAMTALVSEGWGDHDPEYDMGVDAYLVTYVDEPQRGIRLTVGTRVELRSLPGIWTIDCLTNLRVMLRGPAGASAQVRVEDLRAELKTVLT